MVTGHRPKDLFGYDIHSRAYDKIRDWIRRYIKAAKDKYGEVSYISGMALGVDTIFAEEVADFGLPLFAFVPTMKQSDIWINDADKRLWRTLLEYATGVHVTDPDNKMGMGSMDKRNHDMVDRSDLVLGVWTGKMNGGTYNCLRYAERKEKHIITYDPIRRFQLDSNVASIFGKEK